MFDIPNKDGNNNIPQGIPNVLSIFINYIHSQNVTVVNKNHNTKNIIQELRNNTKRQDV